MLMITVVCTSCFKDFYVKVEHLRDLLPAWDRHNCCSKCLSAKKPLKKEASSGSR